MEFEEIYRAHFPAVYRYLRQLCGDEHTAEELASETFFRALQSIDRFRGDCELRVWLCRIARNTYLSWQKKCRHTVELDADTLPEPVDPAPSAEEQLCRQVQARQLRRLVQSLPEPYRDVLLWRLYAELSFEEIGELYGKSANWACVTCHRARNMIRSKWEEQEHET